MPRRLLKKFHWCNIKGQNSKRLTPEEKYKRIVLWARKARRKNPDAFDALTAWVLDDSQWSEDKLARNKQLLMQGVLAQFQAQNMQLRTYLKNLEPSGVVNAAVFAALDRFDEELAGNTGDERLRGAVTKVFADFSVMRERSVREQIAGNKTGSQGVNSVELFGYINYLKDCDAGVQWTLFMPDTVERQQKGFRVAQFEYRKLPAMRFVGRESCEDDDLKNKERRKAMFNTLDAMDAYQSDFAYDLLLQHHHGRGVDVEPWHGFWGRFMKADAPVPEGFVSFDFVPSRDKNNVAGPPFLSQFAYAVFDGDTDAMHKPNAMYDITRNVMLGQGVNIPYPDKYWTAEVFLNGCENCSTAYIFSAEQA